MSRSSILTLAVFACAAAASACGPESLSEGHDGGSTGQQASAVLNGTTDVPQHVGVVQVGDSCSGALLTNQWVLTAAHCFDRRMPPYATTVSFRTGATVAQWAASSQVILHPSYVAGAHPGSLGGSYDVALIRLQTPLTMTVDGVPSTTGYRRRMPQDPAFYAALDGTTLRCGGYGYDRLTAEGWQQCSDGLCNTLHYADLMASLPAPYQERNGIYLVAGSLNQQIVSGDSGGPCFSTHGSLDPSDWSIAGVNHSAIYRDYSRATALGSVELARWINGVSSLPPTAPVPAQNARVVAYSFPPAVTPGSQYTVSVQMQNTGSTVWTAAGNYRLGSQSPQDNTSWGLGRVWLASTDTIYPGEVKTFQFTIAAPARTTFDRVYRLQWRMLQELVAWFGESTVAAPYTIRGHGVCPEEQLMCSDRHCYPMNCRNCCVDNR